MNLRIPGMNNSNDNAGAPMSGSGGMDLSADLNSPENDLLSGSGGDSFASSPTAAKKSNSGIIILLGVVVVAGGALYAMRHIGMTGLPEFGDEIKINYPLERSEKKFEEDYRALLEDLRTSDEVVQVPITEVVMNPFTWKGETEAIAAGPTATGPSDREREITRLIEQRNREITMLMGRLKFTGVMGRRVRSATVNGQLVREGDIVENFFRVDAIGDREITLIPVSFQHTLDSGETVTITPDTSPKTLSLDR